MKRILLLTLSALTIGAGAQSSIPVPQVEYFGCYSDGGYQNMFALDGRFNVLTRVDMPGKPPAYFGMLATLGVPMDTSALHIQVAATVWGGKVVNQVIEVFDFMAQEWVPMSSDAIGGLGPWPPRVIDVIVVSPIATYPAPFIDPATGNVAVRVLWDGKATRSALVDFFDLRPFP